MVWLLPWIQGPGWDTCPYPNILKGRSKKKKRRSRRMEQEKEQKEEESEEQEQNK